MYWFVYGYLIYYYRDQPITTKLTKILSVISFKNDLIINTHGSFVIFGGTRNLWVPDSVLSWILLISEDYLNWSLARKPPWCGGSACHWPTESTHPVFIHLCFVVFSKSSECSVFSRSIVIDQLLKCAWPRFIQENKCKYSLMTTPAHIYV